MLELLAFIALALISLGILAVLADCSPRYWTGHRTKSGSPHLVDNRCNCWCTHCMSVRGCICAECQCKAQP